MTMKRRFAHAALVSLLYLPLSSYAQVQSCDTCSQLSTLNTQASNIAANTTTTNSELYDLLTFLTNTIFSTLPSLGNTAAAFTAIPAIQSNSYTIQQELRQNVEKAYKGSSSKDATLTDNYHAVFADYLLDDTAPAFNPNNASIASLYVNPSVAGYYSAEQQQAARNYIMLVSGAAASTAKAPSRSWLKISKDNADKDKNTIRTTVSSYYTFNAIQSAIADNFAYIYGLNTGQTFEGSLENYSGTTISESGLFTYIQSQKVENPAWYKEISAMGLGGLLKEQTILLGSCFLMLSRIEEDLRRLLITNSVQATMTLIPAQASSQAIAQMPDVQSLMSSS